MRHGRLASFVQRVIRRKGSRFDRRKGKESRDGNLFDFGEDGFLKRTGVNRRKR